MNRLNAVGFDTPHGFKTFEIFHGDITNLSGPVDVLVVSAYRQDYYPHPDSLIGALHYELELDVERLSYDPEYDFRTALGVWISDVLKDGPFRRVLCAELSDSRFELTDIIGNIFASLSLLEAKGHLAKIVAMPLIGTGVMALPEDQIVTPLLLSARSFANRSPSLETIMLIEKNLVKANLLTKTTDEVLGRKPAPVFADSAIQSHLSSIRHLIESDASPLFVDYSHLREEWMQIVGGAQISTIQVAISSRKLAELLVFRLLGGRSENLATGIGKLKHLGIAQWVISYLEVLRALGNDSAHSGVGHEPTRPPRIQETDIILCLMCVERLLEFWEGEQPG